MQTTTIPLRARRPARDERLYRRIIVPLDGTPTAERVLPYVQHLARWFRSDVTLLHVLFRPQRPQSGPDSVVYPDILHDRAHSLATAYLSEIARELIEAGLSPRTVVVSGDTVKVIAAHTPHGANELTALGANARSVFSRMWRESVVDGLLESSHVPLFLVNAKLNRAKYGIPPAPRGLLVAIDGSSVSRRSIPYAVGMARAGGLEVTLLHVLKSRRKQRGITTDADRNGQAHELPADEAGALRRLELAAHRFRDAGIVVRTYVRHGPAAETIVEVQNELGGYVAMIAARARRGLRRAILGSVVDRVLRLAADPVVVIPARGPARERVSFDGTGQAAAEPQRPG
jgi:nucleotide-binding universal stress UspA family protein